VRLRGALAGAALAALACAASFGGGPVLKTRIGSGLEERPPLRRLAVLPFAATGSLLEGGDPLAPPPAEASAQVARFVVEALEARGLEVIPPDDARAALGPEPGPAARLAASRLGAQGVLVGSVHRYRERSGEALGTLSPASVGFELLLFGSPDAARLWQALFDETQRPLSENVLNAARYPGGGSRWLTAAELARWGAGEVAAAFPPGGGWPSR
jgi:hypothetical protein